MNTISFLSYKCKIDTDLELVNTNCTDEFLKEGTYYLIVDKQCVTLTIEEFSVDSSICYWIYVLMGEESPYNPEVINSENGFQSISNPRPRKYIEQNRQYFGILIPKNFTLFSSNQKLNKFLQLHYKESSPNKELNIAPALVDKQEFEKKLRLIRKIKLKYKQPKKSDLFAMPSETYLIELAKNSLDELPTDDYVEIGLSLDIKFKEKNTLTDYYWKFLEKGKINPALKKIDFVGDTYNNFNIIFNTETFQHKIVIKANKDNNGMYNEDNIKTELKYKIRDFSVDF